jgi:hypothetical protein
MKRTTIALAIAAGLGLFAGNVLADPGGYVAPGAGGGMPAGFGQMGGPGTLLGAGDVPPGRGPDMYGWSPCLKKLFHKGSSCSSCAPQQYGKNPLQNPANWAAGGYGMGGPAYNPAGFPPGAYGPNGPMMQGTLVFPNQPFVRSPRDYFMADVNK